MEIIGRVKMIGMVQDVSPTFQKREVVVTSEEQYPQHILVEFVQDKCDLIDPYRVGQLVKIHINLRGREWVNPQGEAKYFNSIHGWRVENMEQPPAPQQGYNNQPQQGYPQQGYGQPQQGYNNNQGFQQNNGFNQPQAGFNQPNQNSGCPPAPNFNQGQEAEDDLPF